MLPQSNATLLAISTPAVAGEWNDASAPPTQRWAGTVAAYVQERKAMERRGETRAPVTRRTVILPSSETPVDLARDEVLTVRWAGVEHQWRVVAFQRPYLAEVAGSGVDTMRVQVEDTD